MTMNTKTIHHTMLELQRLNSTTFTPAQNTTINQLLDVATSDKHPTAINQEFPKLRYLMVGRGGHEFDVSTDVGLTNRLKHDPRNASLKSAIPFRLVPVEADLTPEDRADYRLRTRETYDGADYYAYWVKVVDLNAAGVMVNEVTVADGTIESTTQHGFTANYLESPVATNVSNEEENINNGTQMLVSTTLSLPLDADDINYLVDACEVMYNNDPRYAFISEVALVAATDNPAYTDDVSGDAYSELANAQVMNFISTVHDLQQRPSAVNFSYNLAAGHPIPLTGS